MWGCGAGASAKRVALNYSINVMLKDRPSFFGTAYMSPDGEFPHVFLNPMLARKNRDVQSRLKERLLIENPIRSCVTTFAGLTFCEIERSISNYIMFCNVKWMFHSSK